MYSLVTEACGNWKERPYVQELKASCKYKRYTYNTARNVWPQADKGQGRSPLAQPYLPLNSLSFIGRLEAHTQFPLSTKHMDQQSDLENYAWASYYQPAQ